MRAIRRAIRSALFDRKVNTELFFDSDATADAVLLVAGIYVAIYLAWQGQIGFGGISIEALLQIAISGVVGWLILAVATWFAATRLFQGDGQMQTMMRLHGHAELPILLAALNPYVGGVIGGIGLAWSLAAKVVATRETSSLDLQKSVASVVIGFAIVFVVRLVFQLPFIALSSIF